MIRNLGRGMNKRITLGLLAVAAPFATGCTHVFVGDSITHAANAAYTAAFPNSQADGNPGRGPDVAPFGGTTLTQAVKADVGNVDPDGWLVVQDDGGELITPAFVKLVTDLLPDDRCLAWVSPSNWSRPDLAASQQAVKDGILAQPCNEYVDWHAAVRADPTLVPDGLHPDAHGAQVLADMVKAATNG